MISQILDYFRQTGRKVPELLPAVIFAQTELGETFDAIMRSGMVGEGWLRNNERDSQIEVELADTYMMILLAASAMDVDLEEVLTKKMKRKGWKPAPWLVRAWEKAYGEDSEGSGETEGVNDAFRSALKEYCLSRLEPGIDEAAQRRMLAADLSRQRAELDRLISKLEQTESG